MAGRIIDCEVEHRHQGVEPLDGESLLAQVGLVQEAFERLDFDEPVQQRQLLPRLERLLERARLDLLPEPDPLLVAGDVLDLVGDRPAIRCLQVGKDLQQGVARHLDSQH